MKHILPFRSIFSILFLALVISSCEKADLPAPSCSTIFTGEVTGCGANRSAIYRFTPGTDENNIEIQGDLTYFIGQDAVVTVTGATLNVTQSAYAENTSRNIKLEGAVVACQPVVITIQWTSTNYDNVMSGNWTVKNNEGTELAPAVAGLECDSR